MGPSSQISKILFILLFFLIIYFIYMDTELYIRIQHYKVDRNYYENKTTNSTAPIIPMKDVYNGNSWFSCEIHPLCHITVKALLLDHTNHYVFAPLAALCDNIIGFSRSSFISADMISFTHVGIALLAGKLVSSNNLTYRRFGVVFFQIRTFLDDLDGHVARAKKHIRGERSEVGTSGYYIDGICDGIGCIALLCGIYIYLKNNPPRRGYSQVPFTDIQSSENYRIKVKQSAHNTASKVFCFMGQLLLSSIAWNRYIAVYQDMLERNDVTSTQFMRQNIAFKSTLFFCVAWLWRVMNVHSLLHCVLLSVFCDKVWDFLKTIQYIGYVLLFAVICISEMHVLDIQNFVFNESSLTS